MTPQVGHITLEYLKQLDDFLTVDEPTIRYWAQWLTHLLKIQIEPTSALAMGGIARWLARQTSRKKVLVIMSGSNVDQAKMLEVCGQDCLGQLPSLM